MPIDDVIAAINAGDLAPPPQEDPVSAEFANSSIANDYQQSHMPAVDPSRWYDAAPRPQDLAAHIPGIDPAALDHALAQVPPPGSTTSKRGFSASSKGFPGGPAAVDKQFSDGRGLADQRIADYDTRAAQEEAAVNQHASDLKTASAESARTMQAQFASEAQHLDHLHDMLQTHQGVVQKITADAKVIRQQYMADYQQKLSAVAQIAAMPGNPLAGLDHIQSGALGGAAFAQGFLAAQGINIDVTGQIDRWVQTSMAEHQQKVQNARQGAEDSLHLYDIARQGTQDEYEAQQRYRGMIIEGMKTKMLAQAARFNSPLALSQAAEKAAKLDLEKDAVMRGLADRKENYHIQEHTRAADEAYKAGMLKLEERKVSIQGMEAATHRAALKPPKEPKPPPADLRVADPGAVVREVDPKTGKETGKVLGYSETHRVKDGLPAGVETKAYDTVAQATRDYANMMGAMQALRAIRPKQKSDFAQYGVRAIDMWNEDKRRVKAAYNLAQEKLIKHITGAAAPDAQMTRIQDILPLESFFQEGGNAKQINDLEADYRREMKAVLDTDPALEPIAPDANGKLPMRPVNDNPNDTNARTELDNANAAPETLAGAATSQAVAVGHNDTKDAGFSPSYLAYLDMRPDKKKGDAGTGITKDGKAGQRGEIDVVDHLAALWARPEVFEGNDDDRAEALRSIARLAKGEKADGRTKADPEVAAYAAYVYHRLSAARDPNALYDDFSMRTDYRETPVDVPDELKLR